MDIYFVNDTSSGLNWGSQATTRALRTLIRKEGGNIVETSYKRSLRIPNKRINNRTIRYSGRQIIDTIANLMNRDPVSAYRSFNTIGDIIPRSYEKFGKYANMVIEEDLFQKEVENIRSADVVVINGEGLTYSSHDRCTRGLFFIAYLAKKYLNTKCIMTNHTLDITDNDLYHMVENIYPMLDGVVFREPVSAKKHKELCSNYRVSADPGFYYDKQVGEEELYEDIQSDKVNIRPYSSQCFDPRRQYICVAGNSIYPTKSRYDVESYIHLCKRLQKVVPNILLVVSAESDEELLTPVAEQLGIDIVGLNTSIPHTISLVSNASVYIGGRYHPTIFAAKGGVPIIPFRANTHKIEGVLELLNLDIDIFDPFKIKDDLDSIIDLSEKYICDKSDFNHVGPRSKELANLSKENTSYLNELT
ncbi:polysaccharide pyruvyl transferase family protein [Natrialbaceae archaeon AArc-T1-2]|uniref:polysaccharide pyruvyl transferase family protein n=1 Tax=Natrialbaceae archaeon AArc-T1-2 TaxID=3053904 RepID=UPI00255B40C5|nr:polysaccharide pyruvyl transferase family protein [Natrialbaceae archaeon AArc-T1-2]WIV66371.1 polysaccharide pyruvyl transferase family protein [Natrialbaceae archaeon AArc-T1-2]